MKLFVVVKLCRSFLLTITLYKVCDILSCHLITLCYWVCLTKLKALFYSCILSSKFGYYISTWRLLHELHIVVQASSFDDHCCNSSIKLCCCIWISINNVFQVSITHAHEFLLYIFLLLTLLLFSWTCLQAPLFFHTLCTTSNFVKVQYLGFLFSFCPFDLAFYSLSFFYEYIYIYIYNLFFYFSYV